MNALQLLAYFCCEINYSCFLHSESEWTDIPVKLTTVQNTPNATKNVARQN